jgi:hypothetical protein
MKKTILTFLAIGFLAMSAKAQNIANILADDVIKAINLNAEDAAETRAIYAKYLPKLQAIQQGAGTTQEKKAKAIAELQNANAEMKNVLPADKYAAYNEYTAKQTANMPQKSGSKAPNPQQVAALKAELMKELNINSEQADRVLKVAGEHKTKEKAIRQANKGNTPVIKTEMQKLNVATVTELRTFLSDEQIQKYLALQQKYQQK